MAAQDSGIGSHMYQLYDAMVNNLRLVQINQCSRLDSETIDDMVEYEMMNLRCNFYEDEERFVEQMLLKDPSIKRTTPAQGPEDPCSSVNCRAPIHIPPGLGPASTPVNSRQARKINRAKANYRHQYLASKLSTNMETLDYIRETIKQAQSELLESGLGENKLQRIRSAYGLTEIKKQVDRMKRTVDLADL